MAAAALARLRSAGGWWIAYQAGLTVLVTAAVSIAALTAPVHPLAPWLEGLAAPVLVLLRQRHPLPVYLAAAVIGLCTGGPSTVLLVVLSASLAYHAAHGWQVTAGVAAAWAAFTGAVWWWEGLSGPAELVAVSALFALFAIIPAGVARVVRRRRVLLTAMHRRNVQLHAQQGEVARAARARERTRIARDLHDSLGHKLTLISLYAGLHRTADERTTELLRETSAAAMTELRQILGLLGQDDDQPAIRTLDGLDELVRGARASGARVEVSREGTARALSPLTEHAAYRVIQEGVTNALRHAQGGEIVVSLRYEPDALVAGVTNTPGRRVARQTSGQGLLGLAERVRVAHGMLYHGGTPDGGFRLAATLPYPDPVSSPEPPPEIPAGPDFADLVEHDRRRSRLTTAVTALGIAGVLALCCAGTWLTTAFVVVDRDTFDQARLGQPEADLRERLPDAEVAVTGATGGRAVPGAVCADYQASVLEDPDLVYRFCFRDGTLVDKQEFLDQRP